MSGFSLQQQKQEHQRDLGSLESKDLQISLDEGTVVAVGWGLFGLQVIVTRSLGEPLRRFALLVDINFLPDSNMHIDLCGRHKLNPHRTNGFQVCHLDSAMLNLPECDSSYRVCVWTALDWSGAADPSFAEQIRALYLVSEDQCYPKDGPILYVHIYRSKISREAGERS